MQAKTNVWRPGGEGKKGGRRGVPMSPGLSVALSEAEKAYLAGVFDGEGSIVMTGSNGNYFVTDGRYLVRAVS